MTDWLIISAVIVMGCILKSIHILIDRVEDIKYAILIATEDKEKLTEHWKHEYKR